MNPESKVPKPTKHHSTGEGEIEIAKIVWDSERQRDDDDKSRSFIANQLAPSIAENGLIQPIVITKLADGTYKGIAGWSRCQAFILLGHKKIPYVIREKLREDQLLVLELEENLHRQNLSWQENVRAITKIHRTKTANKTKDAASWGQRETGILLGVSLGYVNQAITLAKCLALGDEEINAAESVNSALKILTLRKEQQVVEKLRALGPQYKKKTAIADPFLTATDSRHENLEVSSKSQVVEVPLSQILHHAVCQEWMAQQPSESFDLIFTDIPYGIDMANLDDIEGVDFVAEEHEVDENISQMEPFLKEAFRLLKDKTYLIFFYDLSHHEKLHAWAKEAGFQTQPYPNLWLKPLAKNRAAHCYWPKTFEPVMVCRKGNAMLRSVQATAFRMVDHRAEKRMQRNPFLKPFEFNKWMLEAFVLPGQRALDPYAGGGSIIRTFIQMGLNPVGIERSAKQFPHLLVNVQQAYTQLHGPQVVFK